MTESSLKKRVNAQNLDKQKAAKEAAGRRYHKTNWKKNVQYGAIIGTFVVVMGGAIFSLIAGSGSGKRRSSGGSGNTKLETSVNDASFISRVTRNADGNFTAAASPFFDKWTYGDIKWGMSGQVLSEMIGMPGAAQYCAKDDDVESGIVPAKFDARSEWPSCVQPVVDMGNCTAGYAFAATNSLAHRYCVADSDKYAKTRLSAQQILSCDKKSKGCNGGGIDFVFSYIQRRGLYPEECLPYAGKNGATCKTDCSEDKKLKALGHCVLGGTKAIKREVRNHGAVVAPMVLHDDFLVYSGGVYAPTDVAAVQYGADNKPIHHAVTILGWGKSEGQNYWLIENAWGKSWGEEGYARVAMGSVLRENYIMVAEAASEENIALAEKRKAEAEARAEDSRKERAERDERIRERQRIREEEMRAAREAAEEEDFDKEFDDDLDIDLDEADDGVDVAKDSAGDDDI